jgi:hypothetical protein
MHFLIKQQISIFEEKMAFFIEKNSHQIFYFPSIFSLKTPFKKKFLLVFALFKV